MDASPPPPAERGFSLVELSIVLVILGLLVGGVLAGQSLIRAAELRAVTTEYNRFVSAAAAFKDKYFALPGDMSNATAFWGATNPVLATCRSTPSSGTSTCNGDSNGQLSEVEGYAFWKQLANAGLIEGTFTNIAGAGSAYDSLAGSNVPGSKVPNGTWYADYWNRDSAHIYWFQQTGNILSLGARGTNTSYPQWSLVTTEEIWNVDTKIDDGKPGIGIIRTHKSTSDYLLTGADSATQATAAYSLSLTGKRCSFIFTLGL